MTAEELSEEINIEMELIESTLQELLALRGDVSGREPTNREKIAAAAFMAHFYSGIENILKRISYFNSIPIPDGETWHVDLFKRFCDPPYKLLPVLFDESLALAMAPYRKFRHIVFHSYVFQVDWNRMQEGLADIEGVYSQFKAKLNKYLQALMPEEK